MSRYELSAEDAAKLTRKPAQSYTLTAKSAPSGVNEQVAKAYRMSAQEVALVNNPKYKSFCEQLEGALLAFERAREWADLIRYLQGVKKVLEASRYNSFPLIPASLTVTFSKRLAQCLNPGLPDGVHLNTLAVYALTFKRIGKDLLARDLALFAAGLFPLFKHASTRVKPRLLDLFGSYLLPLGSRLVSCMSGLVACLLPGMEEPQADTYDRVIDTLKAVCKAGGRAVFMRCIWRTILLSPETRFAALSFVDVCVPSDPAKLHKYLPEEALLVDCLTNSLLDTQVVVRRKVLELMGSHFCLHPKGSSVLPSLVSESNLVRIVHAAIQISCLHDVSLNRRLYAWLLPSSRESGSSGSRSSSRTGKERGSDKKVEDEAEYEEEEEESEEIDREVNSEKVALLVDECMSDPVLSLLVRAVFVMMVEGSGYELTIDDSLSLPSSSNPQNTSSQDSDDRLFLCAPRLRVCGSDASVVHASGLEKREMEEIEREIRQNSLAPGLPGLDTTASAQNKAPSSTDMSLPFLVCQSLLQREEIAASGFFQAVHLALLTYTYHYHTSHPNLGHGHASSAASLGLGVQEGGSVSAQTSAWIAGRRMRVSRQSLLSEYDVSDEMEHIATEFMVLKAANAFFASVDLNRVWTSLRRALFLALSRLEREVKRDQENRRKGDKPNNDCSCDETDEKTEEVGDEQENEKEKEKEKEHITGEPSDRLQDAVKECLDAVHYVEFGFDFLPFPVDPYADVEAGGEAAEMHHQFVSLFSDLFRTLLSLSSYTNAATLLVVSQLLSRLSRRLELNRSNVYLSLEEMESMLSDIRIILDRCFKHRFASSNTSTSPSSSSSSTWRQELSPAEVQLFDSLLALFGEILNIDIPGGLELITCSSPSSPALHGLGGSPMNDESNQTTNNKHEEKTNETESVSTRRQFSVPPLAVSALGAPGSGGGGAVEVDIDNDDDVGGLPSASHSSITTPSDICSDLSDDEDGAFAPRVHRSASLLSTFISLVTDLCLGEAYPIRCLAAPIYVQLYRRFPSFLPSSLPRIVLNMWASIDTTNARYHSLVCSVLFDLFALDKQTVSHVVHMAMLNPTQVPTLPRPPVYPDVNTTPTSEWSQPAAEAVFSSSSSLSSAQSSSDLPEGASGESVRERGKDTSTRSHRESVAEAYKKFVILYHHFEDMAPSSIGLPDCVLLIVSALEDPHHPELRVIAQNWLNFSIRSISYVLEPVLSLVLDGVAVGRGCRGTAVLVDPFYDAGKVQYGLQCLTRIARHAPHAFVYFCESNPAPSSLISRCVRFLTPGDGRPPVMPEQPVSVMDVLLLALLRLLNSTVRPPHISRRTSSGDGEGRNEDDEEYDLEQEVEEEIEREEKEKRESKGTCLMSDEDHWERYHSFSQRHTAVQVTSCGLLKLLFDAIPRHTDFALPTCEAAFHPLVDALNFFVGERDSVVQASLLDVLLALVTCLCNTPYGVREADNEGPSVSSSISQHPSDVLLASPAYVDMILFGIKSNIWRRDEVVAELEAEKERETAYGEALAAAADNEERERVKSEWRKESEENKSGKKHTTTRHSTQNTPHSPSYEESTATLAQWVEVLILSVPEYKGSLPSLVMAFLSGLTKEVNGIISRLTPSSCSSFSLPSSSSSTSLSRAHQTAGVASSSSSSPPRPSRPSSTSSPSAPPAHGAAPPLAEVEASVLKHQMVVLMEGIRVLLHHCIIGDGSRHTQGMISAADTALPHSATTTSHSLLDATPTRPSAGGSISAPSSPIGGAPRRSSWAVDGSDHHELKRNPSGTSITSHGGGQGDTSNLSITVNGQTPPVASHGQEAVTTDQSHGGFSFSSKRRVAKRLFNPVGKLMNAISSKASRLFGVRDKVGGAVSPNTTTKRRPKRLAMDAAFKMMPDVVDTLIRVWVVTRCSVFASGRGSTSRSSNGPSSSLGANSRNRHPHSSRTHGGRRPHVHGSSSHKGAGPNNKGQHHQYHQSDRHHHVQALASTLHSGRGGATSSEEEERKLLASKCIELLSPILEENPDSTVAAILNTFEADLRLSLSRSAEDRPPALLRCTDPETGEYVPSMAMCERNGYLIDLLNSLPSSLPSTILKGAFSNLAWTIRRSKLHRSKASVTPVARTPSPQSLNKGSGSKSSSSVASSSSSLHFPFDDHSGSNGSGKKTLAKHTIPALRVHESAPFVFLHVYAGRGRATVESFTNAWSVLKQGCEQALSLSMHAFTPLWLLGVVHQFCHRVAVDEMPKEVRREVFDLVSTLISSVSALASQTSTVFSVRNTCEQGASYPLVPLPLTLTVEPGLAVDDVFSPEVPRWLQAVCAYRSSYEPELSLFSHSNLARMRDAMVSPSAVQLSPSEVSVQQDLVVYAYLTRSNHPNISTLGHPMAASVSLIALRSLVAVLPSLLQDVWIVSDEREKVASVLSTSVSHVMSVLQSTDHHSLPLVRAASAILGSISMNDYKFALSAWNKSAWEHFMSSSFFLKDTVALRQWLFYVARSTSEHKERFGLLLSSCGPLSSLNINNLLPFNSKGAEIRLRCRGLKRLAFAIHSGRRDQYVRHLPAVVEKLVDALKVPDEPSLHVNVFLCMRVLLSRIGKEHLSSVWPLVLMELIRVLQNRMSDSYLLLEACKFVDLALAILPSTFQLYQWMFLVDFIRNHEPEKKAVDVKPSSSSLSLSAPSPTASPSVSPSSSVHPSPRKSQLATDREDWVMVGETTHFEPYFARFGDSLGVASHTSTEELKEDEVREVRKERENQQESGLNPSRYSSRTTPHRPVLRLRRPIINLRRIHSVAELASFRAAMEERLIQYDPSSNTAPDWAFIDSHLLLDFVELEML